MDRVPSGCARCRCGFESSPFKSSSRRPFVEVYVPASRIDPQNAKVNAIKFWDGEVALCYKQLWRRRTENFRVLVKHLLAVNVCVSDLLGSWQRLAVVRQLEMLHEKAPDVGSVGNAVVAHRFANSVQQASVRADFQHTHVYP